MGNIKNDKLRVSYDQASSRLNANELKKAFGKLGTSTDILNEGVAAMAIEDGEAIEIAPSRRSRAKRTNSVTGRSHKTKSSAFTGTLTKSRFKRKEMPGDGFIKSTVSNAYILHNHMLLFLIESKP